ncbi:TetR/AcrR family transcriptional regulator [Bacillus subtilis]|uniref:TetR/AcrR family transcriptional regulator n=1 Tax=Bacillus subtilis TaxID=1423 RepID=UPI00119B364A|nr:TetR/AcrR family transcriptional regulator [Bacillus subtilis]MED0587419.1 TetR/AcrR family transcriptional regulator [Bacillus subtilis]TWG67684.1 TetR family transcriptional regulator [Bacillus subtilis J24]TWG73821.1 TetR family transcriptional regulator [Bacillus subtilis J26]
MKRNKIIEVALKYFTIHGYEGASLSQIAKEVGIKKQSIYTHFHGKDDLFLQALRDAKETELSLKLQYLNKMNLQDPKRALYEYLQFVIDLFQEKEQLKFWLRMNFYPPAHLANTIEKEVIDLVEKERTILERIFQELIDADEISVKTVKTPYFAFLGVVDSIMMELVYRKDDKRLKDKLEASWTVFWKGISKE